MARDPRDCLNRCKAELEKARGDSISEADADAINEFVAAKDPEDWSVSDSDGDDKATSTLYSYQRNLQTAAKRNDVALVDMDTAGINEFLQRQKTEKGLSEYTLISYSSALRKFYQYHQTAVEPGEVKMPKARDTTVDEADMFTKDEIESMRDACRNARDRFIFEFLLYTGQRVRVIQTLRVKDVFLDESRYRLNPEAEGLKGASGRRPLLGAKNAVRDWLELHPASNDPDAYVLTRQPQYNAEVRPYDTLSGDAVRRAIGNIGDRAGITKPVNPHNFRHNFVTIAKRDYDMDNDTIKYLIGHAPDSSVMETTYSHLSDEDFNRRAEIAAGVRDPEDESPLSPDTCPTCSEPLPEEAKACPRCGNVFTPDAQAVKDDIEADMWDSQGRADTPEEITGLDTMRDMVNEHPKALATLLAEAQGEAEAESD